MTRRRPATEGPEAGAALLTVLLLVAVMATVAVSVLNELRFAVRRAQNIAEREQAQWYALGAETFAARIIAQDRQANPNKTTLEAPWARGPVVFTLENGRLEGQITDASTCFNLNSVVELQGRSGYIPRDVGVAQFRRLLAAVQIQDADAQAIADALVDWIDTDDRVSDRGAEDFDYFGRTVPHRTPNTLIANPTELRALKGMTEDAYQRIRPYVCALPTSDLTVLNVNTLAVERAALLSAVVGLGLDEDGASRVLEGRPRSGWPTPEAFFLAEGIGTLEVPEVTRAQIGFTSRYFRVNARAIFGETTTSVTSLLEHTGGTRARVLTRQLGTAE